MRYSFCLFCVITCIVLNSCDKPEHKTATKPCSMVKLATKMALQTRIDTVLAGFTGDPSIGIIVKNLDTQKVLYQKNSQRSFVPASTTKLLTATAALAILGPDYQYQTSIASNGKIQQQQLQGNLYLQFAGDPSLKQSDLKQLLQVLKHKNIKIIKGNIVVLTPNFKPYKPAPGYMWDDQNFCYAAPADAVILNHNCFKFKMWPNKTLNQPTQITTKRALEFTPIKNDVTTQLVDLSNCPIDMSVNDKNQYHIYGCMPYRHEPYKFDVAVKNPRYYLQQFLQAWLKQNHIHLTGNIIFRMKAVQAAVLKTHASKPLKTLLRHMLKTSDNLYANSFYKTVGNEYSDSNAGWTTSSLAVKNVLQQLGIETKNINLVDGAGLSRYNRLTPKLLLQILDYQYHHSTTGKAFYKALAIAGVDGTLRDFKLQQEHVAFHAKTGNMFAVVSLAGYLRTQQQHLAVVIMINGIGSDEEYFRLARKVLNSVVE